MLTVKRRRNRSEFSPYGPYGHGEAPPFGGGKGIGGCGSGGPGDAEGSNGGVVPPGEQVGVFRSVFFWLVFFSCCCFRVCLICFFALFSLVFFFVACFQG